MKISTQLFGVSLMVAVSVSQASIGETPASEVSIIRSHDTTVGADWMSLKGVAAAGSCSTNDGLVFFLFREDEHAKRQLAIALAAKIAGKKVRIGYDDINFKTNGCLIRYIDIVE